MKRSRFSLLLGLALGCSVGAATGTLILRRAAASSDQLPSRHPSPAASISPSWSWQESAVPPRFTDPANISAALAAWHALRAPDGGPAEFATRATALRALSLRLPSASFPRLLDHLSDNGKTSDDHALRQVAFFAWLELDPAAASRWAGSRPESRDLLRSALDAWSALDPRAAATWACALPDEKLAGDLAYFILPALAETDASAAMALVSARGEAFQKRLLPVVLRAFARHDPAATVRTYGPVVWDGGAGFFQIGEALDVWAERDPAAAIAWVLAQPGRPDWDPSRHLSLLSIKPENRAAFAQALLDAPNLARRQTALGRVLLDWSARDSAAALAWVKKIPDPHVRAALLERAIGSNFDRTPSDRLLPFALALPSGQNRRAQLASVLDKWAQNSPTDALRWVTAHATDPDVAAASASVHAAVLGVIARDDPSAAVREWQALPEGRAKSAGLHTIALAWGRVDPAAALQWQVSQAHPDRPFALAQSTLFQWARTDATAALRWTETLPVDLRHSALRGLTDDGGTPTPPAAALDLYAQIRDPALRAEFVSTRAREWLVTDRPAATAWLKSNDTLSAAQAAALLAPAPAR